MLQHAFPQVDYAEMLAAVFARRAHVQEGIFWSVFRNFDYAAVGTVSSVDVFSVSRAVPLRTIHAAEVPNPLPSNGESASFEEILAYVKTGGVRLY